MDCVYIFKGGESEELRYSIRSVVANFPHTNIWVVGGKPDWYNGNYIEVKQDQTKYNNARNNLLAICDSSAISDTFILMNDDFFVIKPVDSLEVYNGGSLNDKVDNYSSAFGENAYTRMLRETRTQLMKKKKTELLNYELHLPMYMPKMGLREALRLPGVLWRSYCGNMYGEIGKTVNDVKIYSQERSGIEPYNYINSDFPYLSTDDDTFMAVKKSLLVDLFPNKTIYELD